MEERKMGRERERTRAYACRERKRESACVCVRERMCEGDTHPQHANFGISAAASRIGSSCLSANGCLSTSPSPAPALPWSPSHSCLGARSVHHTSGSPTRPAGCAPNPPLRRSKTHQRDPRTAAPARHHPSLNTPSHHHGSIWRNQTVGW